MALALAGPLKERSKNVFDAPSPTEDDLPVICDNGAGAAPGAPRGEDTDLAEQIDSHEAELPQAVLSGLSAHTKKQTEKEFKSHAQTAAIDIPSPSPSQEVIDHFAAQRPSSAVSPAESSFIEKFLRNRRPSVTFHPEVKLESGRRRRLEEPLPKIEIEKGSRRDSILAEHHSPLPRSPLLRAYSEANCGDFDSTTGQPLDLTSKRFSQIPVRPPESHPQYCLKQRKLNSTSASPVEVTFPERGASLTSASTASPVVPEARTPTDPPMDVLLSPVSAFPPLTPFPLEDPSTWPGKVRRHFSASNRANSYNLERKTSFRTSTRRPSRRSTSSSISPATTFLSKFAREDLPPEPDAEGQEVGDYVLGRQAGFGGFSVVREAYTIEGDARIVRAVKIVRRHVINKSEPDNELLQQQFEHEVGLWRCLAHRYILPLFDVHITPFATYCFTKLNTGGTLFDVVKANRKGSDPDVARKYTYQLASAVRYLHEDMKIVHRDIKLENCLIDLSNPDTAENGGTLMLCDFGLAEFYTADQRLQRTSPLVSTSPSTTGIAVVPPSAVSTFTKSEPSAIAGSLQYASPELIMSPNGVVSTASDIWALGVVVYALLAGDLPFQHMFQPRVQMLILAGEWDEGAIFGKRKQSNGHDHHDTDEKTMVMEAAAIELIKGCLDMDSLSRWSISKVLGCRWLWGVQEAVEEVGEGWKL